MNKSFRIGRDCSCNLAAYTPSVEIKQGIFLKTVFLSLALSLFSAGALAVDTDGDGLPDAQDPCPSLAYLDCTFGTNGRVVTSNTDVAHSIIQQADGKFVAVGYYWSNNKNQFTTVRYNNNGSLDSSFNGTGIVNTGAEGTGYGVLQLNDGRLIVAGSVTGDPTSVAGLLRYNTNGTRDTGFVGAATSSTSINAVIRQADGKIVVAGTATVSYEGRFALMRYNADGSLDTSFGTGGKVITTIIDIPGLTSRDQAYAMIQQTDGKLVVVGGTNYQKYPLNINAIYAFAIVRYNSNGTLDTSFNGSGKVITQVSTQSYNDVARAVTQQADGKLVVAGDTFSGNNNGWFDFALVRYNSDGSLDTTFGGDGIVVTPVGSYDDHANSVIEEADGKLVVAGSRQMGPGSEMTDFTLVRYNKDGSLDTSFNGDGKIGLTFPPAYSLNLKAASANTIIQQADGKLVAAGQQCVSSGTYTVCGGTDFAVARYLVDPDTDGDGIYDNGDNCPTVASANQADADHDHIGDICDAMPNDTDNDGVDNTTDNCVLSPNPDQLDSDGDGIGDACETDVDGDGIVNSSDAFPLNASVSADWDMDGAPDYWNANCGASCQAASGAVLDNCQWVTNASQLDSDGDGKGDICDSDDDGDGVSDDADTYPLDPTRSRGQTGILHTFNGSARFGNAVSTAGDVNGDGYVDVIVGEYQAGNAGISYVGRAVVFSGKDFSVLYTFYGDNQYEYFGKSVANAGDVNKDGYADVIVGGPGDNTNGGSSGGARVFSGKDGSTLYSFYGSGAGDEFGGRVSGAGDVNGDGYADVIVGAALNDTNGTDAGSARVFSGKDGSVLFSFAGDNANDNLGISVSGAGDIDKDGYADVIVGAYWDDNNAVDSGSARVFSGKDGTVLYTFNGDSAGDNLGSVVSAAGDVNGDGYPDVIVGAPNADIAESGGGNSGIARVYSGKDGSTLYTFNGYAPGTNFGYALSAAGDVNHDGYADVIVGAHANHNGGNSGSATVFSGKDGSVLYIFDGDSSGSYLGSAVSTAGDVNGDGYADLIVGAWGDHNNAGSARIYSGKAWWTDADGDGINDAVDSDDDNDGILDINDITPRGNGIDTDNDGTINSFDTDDDNDGVPDIADAFPLDASESVDTDHDGIGNNADIDDDNDGVADTADHFPLDATKSRFVNHDNNADGDSDVVTRTTSTGVWTRYSVQNGAITTNATLNIPTSTDTQYIAQLDANGDGDADVLTRSVSTGAWTLYQIQSGAVTGSVALGLFANLDWHFVGAGDFNGDGTDDVLLRSTSSGLYNSFLINNYVVSSVKTFNAWSSPMSVDQGIGDFDGDGTDDLLIRRTTENAYFIFKVMNGLVSNYYCACNLWYNPDWTFQFAGDTNNDGIDDITVRGTGASGDGYWWNFRMNNFVSTQVTNLNLFKDKTRVTLGAVGDYNGDGTIDVLTRVDGSTTYVSPINNGLVTGNNWLQNFTTDQVIGK